MRTTLFSKYHFILLFITVSLVFILISCSHLILGFTPSETISRSFKPEYDFQKSYDIFYYAYDASVKSAFANAKTDLEFADGDTVADGIVGPATLRGLGEYANSLLQGRKPLGQLIGVQDVQGNDGFTLGQSITGSGGAPGGWSFVYVQAVKAYYHDDYQKQCLAMAKVTVHELGHQRAFDTEQNDSTHTGPHQYCCAMYANGKIGDPTCTKPLFCTFHADSISKITW